MARYVIKRIVYMVITLFIIATVTFFLMKLLPGSPLQNQEKLTPEQRQIILEKYGLNDPVPVQYVRYLGNLLKGDLGVSFQYDNRPVTELIGERIGPSAQLGFQAIVLGTIIGLLLGIFAAIRHNTWGRLYGNRYFRIRNLHPIVCACRVFAILYRRKIAMAASRVLGRI